MRPRRSDLHARQGCEEVVNLLRCLALGTTTCAIWEGRPARNTCFRYLAPRGETAPVACRRPQRETKSSAGLRNVLSAVEPTHRRASASGPPPAQSVPRVVPPRVSGARGADTQAVLKTLRGLGRLSEDLLVQVAKGLQPPATIKGFLAGKADGSFERATAQPSWPH